ncbi:cupin domain-containing protein [Patescibacteria group bacterium]|nr:cupin domain-containing protein [Patescibacteria group bacterium]
MKIVSIKNIPGDSVSHNPEIKKKILIAKGEIPQLMTFSKAILKPGQSSQSHAHDTMYEVFFIISGKAIFNINNNETEVSEGDCITIEPNEKHFQTNPFDLDVKFLYFGIATN